MEVPRDHRRDPDPLFLSVVSDAYVSRRDLTLDEIRLRGVEIRLERKVTDGPLTSGHVGSPFGLVCGG